MSHTQSKSDLATQLVTTLRSQNLTLAVAESCTGGLLSAAITDIAGASDVFDRGYITYANRAKTDLLAVPPEMIERHGAVSADVAITMANGVLKHSTANISAAITGVAGPGGGSADKPVGLVFIAVGQRDQASIVQRHILGDTGRAGIREVAVHEALKALLDVIDVG